MLLLKVKTNIEWINDIAEVPVVGGLFLFILIFIPAVLLSFLAKAIVPGLANDAGFTKAMLVLLPGWNLFLWWRKVRIFLFFLPSWLLLGGIAIAKGVLLITVAASL